MREPHGILPPPGARGRDGPREPPLERLPPRARQPRADDLAVDRVRDVHEPPPAVVALLDEPPRLERAERGLAARARHDVALARHGLAARARHRDGALDRRADRHELEQRALGGAETGQARLDELGQPQPRRRRCAAPPPDAAGVGKLSALDAVTDELAQEQRVPAREGPQCRDGAAVRRGAECRGEQPLRVGAGERADREPIAQLVLPQGPKRVGHRLPVAHRDHHERLPGGRELVDQRRRAVVEGVSVVHAQHEPAPGERVAGQREPLDAGRRGVRHERGEGAQGDRGGRARRPHPLDLAAERRRELRALEREPRPADPGRPGDDHAAGRSAGEEVPDGGELAIAPHQRPHERSLTARGRPVRLCTSHGAGCAGRHVRAGSRGSAGGREREVRERRIGAAAQPVLRGHGAAARRADLDELERAAGSAEQQPAVAAGHAARGRPVRDRVGGDDAEPCPIGERHAGADVRPQGADGALELGRRAPGSRMRSGGSIFAA